MEDDNTMRNDRDRKRRNWPARLNEISQIPVALVLCITIFSILIQWQGFWPLKMEMPWSTMDDFVEDRDGNVYVVLAIGRVLQYGPDGKFVRAIRVNGHERDDHCLATDSLGGVYMLRTDGLDSSLYSIAGRPDAGQSVRRGPPHVWRLDSRGQPEKLESLPEGEKAPNRTVRPGELLFSGCPGRYRSFERLDGGTIDWYEAFWETYLEICDGARRCRRLSVSVYLQWLRFPFPAAILLGMIIPYGALYYVIRKLWRRHSPKNY